jgi:hypothetical protein
MRFQPPFILTLALASSLPAALHTGCTESNLAAERAEIERVVNNSIGWALTKDLDLLYSSLAQDSAFFIFHPDSASTVIGWAEFEPLTEVWMNPAFVATRFQVKDLRINLSRSGTVAWYSATLDDFGEWQGEPVGWENARWTGVLEKRDGRWLITQMHFSFSVEQIRAEAEADAVAG